ncbi:hypothetical protein BHE74_00057833 [Ensete ventricosum]|nr:hypothetical protein BHE74_00057833 [Ensete ventricosum]
MRLNRVESFNAYAARTVRRRGWPWLAARGSRLRPRPPARWRLAMANHPCRGGRLQPRPPFKGAAGHLQGAATRGRDRLRPASRSDCQRRACKRRPPAAPAAGVATPWQGGCQPQRAMSLPARG